MKTRISNYLKKNDLVRNNIIFFIGTLSIAVFNYLYYPVVGRLVSVSEFGEIQASIAIFMQLGIILTAFGYVVTNIVNNTKNPEQSNRLIIRLEQLTLILSVVVLIAICASSVLLKDSLQFTSVVPLVLVGFLVVLNVPSTSRSYVLQGLRRLKEVSLSGIIFALGKLLVTILLILLGYSVVAVMIGYIIAQTATLIYLLVRTQGVFPSLGRSFVIERKIKRDDAIIVRSEIIYGIAIIVLLSGITLLYSSDSVVVRLFFSPEDAGMYSAVSAISRIVFFITASVAGVLLATIKMEDSKVHNLRILRKSLLLITMIGGLATVFFALFPAFSVTVLFGSKYVGVAHLLPYMSLLMLLCSYNNLLVCYEIALRRFRSIFIVVGCIFALFVSVILYHDNYMHVILGYLASNALVFMLLSVYILKRKENA